MPEGRHQPQSSLCQLPLPFSETAQLAYSLSLYPLKPHSSLYFFFGECKCKPVRVRSAQPLPTQGLSPQTPSTASFCRKTNLSFLPKEVCPLCCSCLSHGCPAPLFNLYLNPWAAPRADPSSQVPFWCHVRHFAWKSYLGKGRKGR